MVHSKFEDIQPLLSFKAFNEQCLEVLFILRSIRNYQKFLLDGNLANCNNSECKLSSDFYMEILNQQNR
jgi:hypothetical protein